MVMIDEKAPEFEVNAFHEDEFKKIKLSDYSGKFVVLMFYPADFTFVCPTELADMANYYEEIKAIGGEVLSVSTDTEFVHKAWYDNSPTIAKIKFPMLADPSGKICKDYGTYIDGDGLSWRATFIIDPDGILKAYEIHSNDVGRSVEEIVRKLKALKFARENPGVACPANWREGGETLKPGIDLVGKI